MYFELTLASLGAKGAGKADAAAEAGPTEVAFEDTDGDAVVFKRRPDGKLDYYVNGTLKVEQLTSLVQRGGTLHLDGRSAGSWGSARVTTPSSFDDAMAAIALYESAAGKKSGKRLTISDMEVGMKVRFFSSDIDEVREYASPFGQSYWADDMIEMVEAGKPLTVAKVSPDASWGVAPRAAWRLARGASCRRSSWMPTPSPRRRRRRRARRRTTCSRR